jgi:hypothetical protein
MTLGQQILMAEAKELKSLPLFVGENKSSSSKKLKTE